MTFGTRVVFASALFATTLLLAGCDGESRSNMRLVLTDNGCTYEGDTTLAVGPFSAEWENQTSKLGAFELAKIDPGKTFADVEAYVASEQERLDQGLEILGPPTWFDQVVRGGGEAGESGMLLSGAPLTAGEYVLWCASEHPPTALYLVTSLEVSE